MRAANVLAFTVVVTLVAGIAWWRLSPDQTPTVTPEVFEHILAGLDAEDCWRKHPDTDEMVCNYKDVNRTTYSVRFNAGTVTEVVRGSKLGGRDMPPFNQRVESP